MFNSQKAIKIKLFSYTSSRNKDKKVSSKKKISSIRKFLLFHPESITTKVILINIYLFLDQTV